ncbi:hypothetical protein ABIC61_002580 [Curtobacterium sp. 1544]
MPATVLRPVRAVLYNAATARRLTAAAGSPMGPRIPAMCADVAAALLAGEPLEHPASGR